MALDLERLLEGYHFSSSELGELVRGLFPNDYRRDQEISEACLAPAPVTPPSIDETVEPEEEVPEPQQEPRRRRTKRRKKRNTKLLWVVAVALLLIGLVLLMVALI
jgi:predicted nucleic acid-binding Zn ribbon protein